MQEPPSPIAPALDVAAEGLQWSPPEPVEPKHPSESGSVPSGSRVCDNCIWKKVKCDLRRPTCSPCLQRGYTCTYSSIRRRPGPARGSRRGARRANTSHARQRRPVDRGPSDEEESSTVENASLPRSVASCGSDTLAISESSQENRRTEHSTRLDILPEEEEYLLEKFLDMVLDAVPIFSKARFLPSLKDSLYSRDLVLTLLILTAKLTSFKFASDSFDLDSLIDLTLSSGSLQEDVCGDSISLDQFRKACLLAFYEFHQFPGQQAWMRVGKLTRLAYWIGLDRLDRLESFGAHDRGLSAMSRHDIEDWRLVWWFVYRLDTYANLSSGTPYLIDERIVQTALAFDEQLDCRPESQQRPQKPKLFLPFHPDSLWELVPPVTSDSHGTSLFNLHIITATATRQVGRALQLHMLGLSGETMAPRSDLERRLSALRLALPRNYLNPMRNAFVNETRSSHHARLITVLHLLMARLLISLLSCASLGEGDEWLLSWQQVLETCQDIASISEQWNSAFSLSVDPAVVFIIFTALIFVHLHKNFAGLTNPTLHSNLEHYQMVLLLLLEQFASTWTLPRLLVLSFKGFRELMVGPFSYSHIRGILARFEAPLHPRWLQFLSTDPADLDA
ncbi:hypothetical protein B0T10DRAFT_523717 [Thelonectria olida]|uniref:Zn(2)-C6 fungal-type domain-containing protein n=1 Tax=Thelonectria olida TaxID=1576542 RepID=A0A9P8VPG9_9HYPO|nr:hypothetical protein B0T10DRAFT_523717 [Thelonectria olida]